MPHDLVLRGGRVVDGTGLASFTADVAIVGDRIVEIGRVASAGAREVDADGLLVTPGFIDAHTHMDAQLNWDPLGGSSSWQGVTTAVMGNCGFTIAPVRRGEEGFVLRNLERAEDISAAAMAAGIKWRWESFADYLDVVDQLPKGINYACNIGHSALRTWAMGERAFTEAANDDDLALMEGEVRRALDAGAVGFTTSRSPHHETSDDKPVSSRAATWDEVVRLAGAAAAKGGIFELAQERSNDPAERADFFNRLRRLAVEHRALVTFGLLPQGPREAWEAQLDLLDQAAAAGGRIIGQTHSRGVSMVVSFETTLPFDRLPEWQQVRRKPLSEQKILLRDRAVREKLIHAAQIGNYGRAIGATAPKPDWSTLSVYQNALPPNPTVAEVARARGVDPVECMIDLALESDMKAFFISVPGPVDEADLLRVMRHPRTVMTFSDAGAHTGQIIDACVQTYLISHWARDLEAFTIEDAVRMVTLAPARTWGIADRGLLRPGMAADINLIDLAALSPGMPATARDLPSGALRLVMKPEGIKQTIVGGQVLFDDCDHTGALPGKLLRNGRG